LNQIFTSAAELFSRKGVVIVISDLFGDTDQTLKGLRMLRQRGHDVLLFHVLDDDELDFPFTGSTQFNDLEDYALVRTSESMGAVLASFLSRRIARNRG